MKRMKVMCVKCAGIGYIDKNIAPSDDGLTFRTERYICNECNGAGYTEYAMFSIEEAEVILKHCGLTVEN